ncbi:MAG: tRNA pseudouridine(55) synthase TruB [Deltaproteobacteria bacterium RIFCSPLOWO2_12_FULL_43_16]|nr:MAG: tRNA pseudouridine(55) synthase TruB [Deltaproteobacteria bacterium GWA2_43_19]OGQ13078.1 MAG: tRNA pseudouridine(55) synthase TruB [Deltaproteobacteria bacterium RIFCSPHIGHO2_02_FULL_43_33]OGQ44350.1 MAG: tRNA pseudouridine(55) synthase TruB [Deltaproteobacteria bacterium RIFCSPLOWO2_01_FULL_42_9]OGQ57359.1 MAG: tRNA pseudouridine(55) synthase TruB [Deltaproteobacteria bacterium RIFCSPLOWO2_12_FULL_43_16]HBR17547.1 tRNA pseudouridine(55) synthase TruB [Deltaproteobacteria bacterium]
MRGVLVVDKPAGPTSHDVVMMVKKRLRARKVGHIGTLDPFATGVLPLCINDATRLARFLEDGKKEYIATIKLGEETDTYDKEGRVVAREDTTSINREDIISVLMSFKGRIQQVPPIFSAIKVNGTPLYRLARQGVIVERKPKEVEIYDIEIKDIEAPFVSIRIVCSKGTYIRSLAFDAGRRLGCGAHLISLRRTKNGHFSLEQSISIDKLEGVKEDFLKENIISIERLFANIPDIEVDKNLAERIIHGVWPKLSQFDSKKDFLSSIECNEMVRFTLNGRIIALARHKGNNEFKLEKVFQEQLQ